MSRVRHRSGPVLGALLLASCGDTAGDVVVRRGQDAGAPTMGVVDGAASSKDTGQGGAVPGSTCLTSHECSDEQAFCHPKRHVCVECLSATDCDESRVCTPSGTCGRPCASAADCGSDYGGFCDAVARVCVECRMDSDCSDGDNPSCVAGMCMSP